MVVVKPVLTFKNKHAPLTVQVKEKLKTFENNMRTHIYLYLFNPILLVKKKNHGIREITKVPVITSYVNETLVTRARKEKRGNQQSSGRY